MHHCASASTAVFLCKCNLLIDWFYPFSLFEILWLAFWLSRLIFLTIFFGCQHRPLGPFKYFSRPTFLWFSPMFLAERRMSLKDHFLLIKAYGAHSFIIIIARVGCFPLYPLVVIFICLLFFFSSSLEETLWLESFLNNPFLSVLKRVLIDRPSCRFRSRPNTRTWLLDSVERTERSSGNLSSNRNQMKKGRTTKIQNKKRQQKQKKEATGKKWWNI